MKTALRFPRHRQPHPRPKCPKMPATYPQATKLFKSASIGPVRLFSFAIHPHIFGINNDGHRLSITPPLAHGIGGTGEGPGEVLRRKRPIAASLPKGDRLPHFATAWLAFDGFSPESARGPHTPNLLHTRKKWLKLAPEPAPPSSSSARSGHDDLSTTAAVPPSQEPVDAGTGPESEPVSASEAQTEQQNVSPPREWVPIIPGGPRRPMPALASIPKVASASTPLDHAHTTEAAESHIADNSRATPTTPSATTSSTEQNSEAAAVVASETVGHKMSRRERILHLARQNARTPLPEPVEVSQPPAPTEAKTVDEEESERHVKERTIHERLWRLVGGNY